MSTDLTGAKPRAFSPVGLAVMTARESLLQTWMARLRRDVKHARNVSDPVLLDTIPYFIEQLAETLSPEFKRDPADGFTIVAEEHGGERARVTAFTPEDIIREYHTLRDVVIEHLERHASISPEELRILRHGFELALRQSVTSFAIVQANLRDQFIATLSHDLQNPIGVVRMAAELALDDFQDSVQLTAYLNQILENATRAERMIRDLLDTTVVRSGGKLALDAEPFYINNVIVDVVSNCRFAERVTVVGERVHGIWGRDLLRRALDNLLTNAFKYGDDSSPITIKVESANGRMLLSVHNEGTPIPIEEQEAILQIFRRSDLARRGGRGGWGLGLPFVRGVAESHGGSLLVESVDDRGTTFTIDIPIDPQVIEDLKS